MAIVLFVMGIYWLLKLIYITVDNTLAVDSGEYVSLQEQIQKVHTENLQLQEEILYKSSLDYINNEAIHEGFIPLDNNLIYLY